MCQTGNTWSWRISRRPHTKRNSQAHCPGPLRWLFWKEPAKFLFGWMLGLPGGLTQVYRKRFWRHFFQRAAKATSTWKRDTHRQGSSHPLGLSGVCSSRPLCLQQSNTTDCLLGIKLTENKLWKADSVNCHLIDPFPKLPNILCWLWLSRVPWVNLI